jgi:hypothetical protein
MNVDGGNLDAMVRAAGARLKWSALLAGLCRWLALSLGLWFGLFVMDNLLSLPAGLRLPLALGGAAICAVQLFRLVLRPAWRPQTPERTAVMLERRYGIADNLLINALQFQRQSLRPEEQVFAGQTIARSGEIADRVQFNELWDWRALRVWGGATALGLVFWLAFIALYPRQFTAAVGRYALPLGDTPPPGRVVLKLTPDGDVTVPEGGQLDVALEVGSPGHPLPANPPVLVWRERTGFIEPVPGAGENLAMTPGDNKFVHTFANLEASFAFRVFAGDTFTRSIQVTVRPRPQLKNAQFRVSPPAYTGLKPQVAPGPPAPVSALPGSLLEISFQTEPPVEAATWNAGGEVVALENHGGVWRGTTTMTNAGGYDLSARSRAGAEPVTLAHGDLRLLADNPPEVDFVTDDRNRVVQFGETLALEVVARDDYGLADVAVVSRPVDKDDAGTVVKRWTYLGPPGNPGPVRETLSLTVDPRVFESGATYYLEALADDFRPGGAPARSRPIVLRVKSAQDITLPDGDPLAAAFAELKLVIAAQEKAARLTANLQSYLAELKNERALADQTGAIGTEQNNAISLGRQAVVLFDAQDEGKPFSAPLSTLVYTDMMGVQTDLRDLPAAANSERPGRVTGIVSHQEQILSQLLSLLGRIAAVRADQLKPVAAGKEDPQPPATAEERQKELLEGVQNFVADQERILEKSRTLADKGPEDLTQSPSDILGELAREEDKWAKFLEEKLTDFSKLPSQDFADASLAQELNSVYQEVQPAADALTQKNVELAVPKEQSGLENAQELVNNLERWLPDTADHTKWNMEEPTAPTDIALAELPKELEDIVGDLLDQEDAMTPDVEDVTSSWMDSLDKGAGWGANDGPISDMSAKGVTGNQLPNQDEIGGRSGEGRTGRSHGQMVSDTAEGKGGRETPTRLDPEPFEQGSVKDSAKDDQGGATGGGKVSGFAGEGLRGPTAPGSSQKMPRLAEQQAKIRQQAEALALQLRRYHLSSGPLETSVNAMNRLEQTARNNDGLGVRRAFNLAVSALGEAKQTLTEQVTVRREQDKLPPWMREEIRIGVRDGIPKGYEEMAGEYFRALAEGDTK